MYSKIQDDLLSELKQYRNVSCTGNMNLLFYTSQSLDAPDNAGGVDTAYYMVNVLAKFIYQIQIAVR